MIGSSQNLQAAESGDCKGHDQRTGELPADIQVSCDADIRHFIVATELALLIPASTAVLSRSFKHKRRQSARSILKIADLDFCSRHGQMLKTASEHLSGRRLNVHRP